MLIEGVELLATEDTAAGELVEVQAGTIAEEVDGAVEEVTTATDEVEGDGVPITIPLADKEASFNSRKKSSTIP